MELDVLFEDNHCLAANKPAGLPSQPDASGAESLIDVAARYLKVRYRKPGNVYVGLVHRLDRPTSGVVLLARTSKAAGRLSAQLRAGAMRKLYWAWVEGQPGDEQGEWIDRLEKDQASNRSRVVREGAGPGKEARVSYRVLERSRDGSISMLELRPATGRGHQLRVQLAHRGLPILGDGKYGATTRVPATDGGHRIALHARELVFNHPTRGEAIAIEAPVPADWPAPSPATWERRRSSSRPGGSSGP